MFDVNNCGTVLQSGLGRTCAAEGVGVGRARTGASEDHSPTNIMHAAYVGALELIKSMVAVSGHSFVVWRSLGKGSWGSGSSVCFACTVALDDVNDMFYHLQEMVGAQVWLLSSSFSSLFALCNQTSVGAFKKLKKKTLFEEKEVLALRRVMCISRLPIIGARKR